MLCYFPLTTKKINYLNIFFDIIAKFICFWTCKTIAGIYIRSILILGPIPPNIHAHAENVLNTFKKNTLGLNESQKILNLASNLLTLKIKDFKPQS